MSGLGLRMSGLGIKVSGLGLIVQGFKGLQFWGLGSVGFRV